MGWDRNPADVFWFGQPLPERPTSDTVPVMPATEVIEYTHSVPSVDSTSIKKLWYNEVTQRMTVEFQTGTGTYSYDGVSPALWTTLINAESVGSYFARIFRKPGETWAGVKHSGRLRYAKVTANEPELESDVDEVKVAKLTAGRGKVHQIDFTFSGASRLPVRAESPEAALELFRQHFAEKGIPVEVTGMYIDLSGQ